MFYIHIILHIIKFNLKEQKLLSDSWSEKVSILPETPSVPSILRSHEDGRAPCA